MANNLENDKPILITESKKYTLKEILYEIRTNTDIGRNFVKKVNNLTIELIMRNKENIS